MHKVLLGKLGNMGLSGKTLTWFRFYLTDKQTDRQTDRQQRVSINWETSEPHSIAIDVPQSSILGPLLFNIYVNSLPNAVENTRVILYADGAVLLFAASTPQELQEAFERVISLISVWYTD